MMKKSKIVLGLHKYTEATLEIKANAVLTAMTGNANFTEPKPSLDGFGTAIKNFTEAMAAAQSRDRVKVAVKNDMRRALETVMSNLASYVEFIAQGDRAIQISSGLPVNSLTNNPIALGNPENFSVQLGRNSGEVVINLTVEGGKNYTYFYALAPVQNDEWLHFPFTASSFVITGLERGKEYSFRVRVNGARGQQVYTDTITRLVV